MGNEICNGQFLRRAAIYVIVLAISSLFLTSVLVAELELLKMKYYQDDENNIKLSFEYYSQLFKYSN
ncbi:hypothetical protein RhiirA4_466771 [Rhizophagus irregularis]|uniref:Uncharacterized protein n=1 Tax=Rhizophagus irregularis TaxID=588596 RepID=A0A2I1GUX8_9GLOM|nr:hypothetical protein RhiirA4_466771 [Rhizophagus irregularis]